MQQESEKIYYINDVENVYLYNNNNAEKSLIKAIAG